MTDAQCIAILAVLRHSTTRIVRALTVHVAGGDPYEIERMEACLADAALVLGGALAEAQRVDPDIFDELPFPAGGTEGA